MKPQIQLSLYIPETTPEDKAFPIRVAVLKLTPPSKNSSLTFEVGIGLDRNPDGEVTGYTILLNGARIDPETIDTLPEATMRACLNFCTNVVPQWLQRHIREYATRQGLETAFLRREAYGKYQDQEEYTDESGYEGTDRAYLSNEPDGDTEQVSEAEGAPENNGRLGKIGSGPVR
jgi:hypothetical protein